MGHNNIPEAGINNGGSPLHESTIDLAFSWGKKNLSRVHFAGLIGVHEATVKNWYTWGEEVSLALDAGEVTLDDISEFRQLCYRFYSAYNRGRAERAQELVQVLDQEDNRTAKWLMEQLARLDDNYKPDPPAPMAVFNIPTTDQITGALREILRGDDSDVIDGKATYPELDPGGSDES